MVVLLQPTINLFVDVSIIALQLFRESYLLFLLLTVTEVSQDSLKGVFSNCLDGVGDDHGGKSSAAGEGVIRNNRDFIANCQK